MLNRLPQWALRGLASFLIVCVPSSLIQAQTYIPSPQELDQLLAPVALYPDALLAQITTASTNPQEILDVDTWLRQNSNLSGVALTNAAQAQGFDPAFIALVNFPQVLDMMAQNIDDYAAIGDAFQANQASVMDSVQRLRENAYESGALESNAQQQVEVQSYNGQQIIVIQPANPQIVYVPQYNPAIIYGGSAFGPGVALITFGAGIGLGIVLANSHPWGWGNWGWNWHSRSLLYHRAVWRSNYNRYRPPRPTYRPSRPNYGNRPVIRPPRPNPNRPPRPNPNRPRPTPKPTPRPTPKPTPRPAPKPTPRPAPKPTPRPAPKPRPAPQPKPAPRPSTQVKPAPQSRPERQEAPQANF